MKEVVWSCKFPIYPTEKQKVFLAKQFGAVRFVYNYTLARSNETYEREKRTVHINDLKKELPRLKAEKAWLKEVNSQSLQEAVLNLGKSRDNFLKGIMGRPRFKKKNAKQSCCIPQHFYIKESRRGNNFLYIPKLKLGIRAKIHRKLFGKAKRVVITKAVTGRYFAAVSCEVKKEEMPRTVTAGSGVIGIDLGIISFITTSNGKTVKYPKFLKSSLNKIAKLSRSLSKKQRGSNNREKAKLKLARAHEVVSNRRSVFIHKVSSALINENQVIYAEDLHVKGMVRNRRLSRAILDTSMRELVRQLEYKADWKGSTFTKIGRFEPSSKMCSNCQAINKYLKLHHRTWRCDECGSKHDRDVNAAINILKIGQRMSLGKDKPDVKPVERSTKVFSNKKKQVGSVKQEPVSNVSIGMHGNSLP